MVNAHARASSGFCGVFLASGAERCFSLAVSSRKLGKGAAAQHQGGIRGGLGTIRLRNCEAA